MRVHSWVMIGGFALLISGCASDKSKPEPVVVPAWCTGKWEPPSEPRCDQAGAACDDGNACTTNDRCRRTSLGLRCRGNPEPYCIACQAKADCCGTGLPTFCLTAGRAMVVPHSMPEMIDCVAGRCALITTMCHDGDCGEYEECRSSSVTPPSLVP